jgi:Uma2 family endonuclease
MTTDTELLSLAQYAAIDDPEGAHVTELVRGLVVREPRPRQRHGEVQAELTFHLKLWARERDAVVTVESGFVLSDNPATVRGPDVAVVLGARAPGPHGWVTGAPDLAVEVLSPSDSSTSVHRKTLEYLESGAAMVWIVDPEARTITVFRPDGSASVLREGATVTGEDVLEGLSVPLAELFSG